ncbi:2,3,4,5-tetrahydropyridine-2,6-dicarboxylate N-acetyltransferase [Clostridium saccharobutylicum]|uniref:gamma carbonic anhydrase family protein n=1 Tax=Clostridium saccharobutylicum TaxID=169679 RepID=UPI00098401BE|nr:gamma carbonic anhydrase family protein [Clostridium saccharobutylicum]AQS09195.1 2,3,4,5-tetrahydropyridine-2,6-dicarboxylate N-acetyltransferase [Clostridium saccharobutylicum]MBC2435305.1 gamma carbonic anhydrase family protein [Clostridium saccharobutylicum]NSB87430.1 carbonic anhydrase/acetyltransferase-like protein (isoleucine patch superfamily) [Clostridium saccharobutylicum]NYC28442.1 carbonic anhydrase/acetyltransferase-like protein (isoleucine patch superfamily) [Clostridium saccha
MIKSFMNKKPKLEEEVYVSETSVIIGDVTLRKKSNVWFGAVIRGDEESIVIGEKTNIQENSVLHVDKTHNIEIGDGCTIGHGAIIHGCKIGSNTLIGMGAIILNGAKIGNNTIVGAGSLVTQNKEFDDGVLIIGNPARAVRKLTEEEIKGNRNACLSYIELSNELR